VLPVDELEERTEVAFLGFTIDFEKEFMDNRLMAITLLLYALNMLFILLCSDFCSNCLVEVYWQLQLDW
jgi:hypothetical protein